MSVIGPTIWRTTSHELSLLSLPGRTTFSELTPLRRALQRPPTWGIRHQSSFYGIAPRMHVVKFTTAARWGAQIALEPKDVPIQPKDSASAFHDFEPVSPAAVKEIFGVHIGHRRGNELITKIQVQRVAGTLDEGILGCEETVLNQGLQWLRTNYPLDEDAATIARLEREEAQESQVLIDRAERLGIYKSTDDSEPSNPQIQTSSQDTIVYTPQQDPERNRVLGTSLLDKKRLANEAAYEAEQAVKKAEREAAEAEAIRIGKPVPTSQTQAVVRKQRLAEKKAQWQEHVKSVFGKPAEGQQWPTMTKFQRLWPSAVFTAAVIGLSALFAHYYTPPPKKARIWPDIPPAAATVLVLIGMNVLVFFAWQVVPLQRTLFKYFMTVPGYPRAVTVIGNTFSHQAAQHLTWNMVVLWVFGTRLHDDIGRGQFLATYLSCGAFSSFFSLSAYVFTNSLGSGALGPSGVIAGLVAAWCLVNSE